MLQDNTPNFLVISVEFTDVRVKWFKFSDLEGNEFTLEGRRQGPSAVNVARRESVGSRSVVNHELYQWQKLTELFRRASKNILDHDSKDLLRRFMMVLDQSLLHRSPRSPESVIEPYKGRVFLH